METTKDKIANAELNGLNSREVEESRLQHGTNVLTPPPRVSVWRLYIEKYDDPIIRILLVAALVSLLLSFFGGSMTETLGIILAVLLATTVGFYFERDAARKFDMLTQLDEDQLVKVIRDGHICQVARRDVVVGDVVVIETGDEVPADGTLLTATDLQVDESSLTGEQLTTKRIENSELITENSQSAKPIIHNSNNKNQTSKDSAYPSWLVLRSSMVMNGTGRYRVTAVGDETEIGRVARQSAEPTGVKTPLSLQLEKLAKLISKVGTYVAVAAFVLFLGHDILTQPVWHTSNYMEMVRVLLNYFMMAVTLIVMAVPEGLPMAVTLALALNMRRMLSSNILVRKLHACETMGAVTTICTDKTGTLTENRMTVSEMMCGNYDDVLPAIAMNTTAELDAEGRGIGNPTEAALLDWMHRQGADYKQYRQNGTAVVQRMPFSTERKFMATLTADGTVYMKGAPEVILNHCSLDEDDLADAEFLLRTYQDKAMRTLAFATKKDDSLDDLDGLQLQGICAISDPVRNDAAKAVANCKSAGIRLCIVTGDTARTAMEIARQVSIITPEEEDNDDLCMSISGRDFSKMDNDEALNSATGIKVMSRARPQDKRRLVKMLQERGEVVAVTGDGTNDAPALNRAHVGVSLGSGTSVAKQASDITLLDDSLSSLVKAVMWGRSLYRNIQRFIFFQLVVNVAALLLVLGGSLMGTELPLTVTQILWVNLIMDTFAAMALASLPPSREVMNQPPRRTDAFIITRPIGHAVVLIGTLFAAVMLVALYYIEYGGINTHELTIFFTTFVMMQWWNLFNARALLSNHSALRNLQRCPAFLLVLLLVLVGQWLIVTFGGDMFRTEPLSWKTWLTIFAATSPVMLIGEVYRTIKRLFK